MAFSPLLPKPTSYSTISATRFLSATLLLYKSNIAKVVSMFT